MLIVAVFAVLLAGQALRGLGDRLEHGEGYSGTARSAVAVTPGVHPKQGQLDVGECSSSAVR